MRVCVGVIACVMVVCSYILGTLRIWSPSLSCPSMSAGVLGTISLITTSFSLASVPPITLSPSGPLPLVTSMSNSSKVGTTTLT